MDFEEQSTVQEIAAGAPREGVVVVLGSPDAESAALVAETLSAGDPTFAGPLAGVPLGLRSYHILEPEIEALIDGSVYEEQVGFMSDVLDRDAIAGAVKDVRERP
jgi:betaine reductase